MDEIRDCSRCDGKQHLVAHQYGFGKYGCDTCEMVVGFDADRDVGFEILLHRGLPWHYTKGIYGPRLMPAELSVREKPISVETVDTAGVV